MFQTWVREGPTWSKMGPGDAKEGHWRPKFERRRKQGARMRTPHDFWSDFGSMLEIILSSCWILFGMCFRICFGMDVGINVDGCWIELW